MTSQGRSARVKRETKETTISLELVLDGSGKATAETGVGFFDHMLDLFAKHGGFDLTVEAKGDTEVDFHHTVEDTGICLGQALAEAIGDGGGIRRFGNASVPMQEALAAAAVDICGRAYLVYHVENPRSKVGDFDTELAKEFFLGLVTNAKITAHVNLLYGSNQHHIIEAVFKAVAQALRDAVQVVGSADEIPSTKGVL